MDANNDESNRKNNNFMPDEGWWAAVLADEPLIEEQVPSLGPVLKSAKEKPEDKRLPSDQLINWTEAEKIFTSDEIISMAVVGYNRGGLLVSNEFMHGFVPASHLVEFPSACAEKDKEQYFIRYGNRKIAVKIIEYDPKKERIVYSERAALAKEGQRLHLLHNLYEGDIVSGIVTNITDFGAFVDLGGVEGLIHVSELSWGRVQHPSDILKVDEEIKTIVLQVDEEKGRIALSLKQLEVNPWEDLKHKVAPGDVVDARITTIVKYGAFARLTEGVEGLIHISSIKFPDDCHYIEAFLSEGQPVKVSILNIDIEKRRLGLKLENY